VGIISFRVDKAEMRNIRQEASARGFVYVSELVREKMGLPPGSGKTAASPMMEKIDLELDREVIQGVLRELVERSDQLIRMTNAIGRHVGAPKASEEYTAQVAPAKVPHVDPAVTAGFER
jgi:hypothetical protein